MPQFLTDEWFTAVSKLNEQAGELPLAPTLQSLIINSKVTSDNEISLHFKDGKLWQGSHPNAQSTVITDSETLASLIHTKDSTVAIEAFMTGKIRVEGDMSALLSLQSTKPSPEQKALYKEILAITEF